MSNPAEPSEQELDAYFDALQACCNARKIDCHRIGSAVPRYLRFSIQGSKSAWELSVDCGEERFRIPTVLLMGPHGLFPHVSYNGIVCVNDGEGLSIDLQRHADIIAHTALAAYDLLERWTADEVACGTEFFNELEGYWSGLPGSLRGRASIEVDSKDRFLTAHVEEGSKPHNWYLTERNAVVPKEFFAKKTQARRALYLHLESVPPPPSPPGVPSVSYLESVRACLNPAQVELWNELLSTSRNGTKKVAFFVSTPRQAGGQSLVGVSFTANRLNIDTKQPVVPLTMRRQTASYMRERGGATPALFGKHVAILGCGAVGSVVADLLAASGIGRLTLVDPDDFSEDNVYRHVLDPIFIGSKKTWALKLHLERKYPGLEVNPVAQAAQSWFASERLKDLDGVVIAFGAPSVERLFSRWFKKELHQLPVVFTWLEAMDLGGHSVLTWTQGEGCLECLYRDDEGLASLLPRTAYLEGGQHVTRNLTGCASTFVPYGALQARRTGLMAAEHILGALQNSLGEPSYRHWVGEGTAAQAQGLRLTNWWSRAGGTSHSEATKQVFGRPCKHCRGGQ